MRQRIPWFVLLWLRPAIAATLDAAAGIHINQANETAINSLENEIASVEIDAREVSGKLSVTPTYTSYLTTVETITAPSETITSFYSGPDGGTSAGARSSPTTSTAASSMTPTANYGVAIYLGTCSMPPTVTAPCIISDDGKCVKEYYSALQSCYKDGTFSTLRNIARYVIECQNELGDNGSYNGFKDCSKSILQTELNRTGTISRRNLVESESLLTVDDAGPQRIGMMDQSSIVIN
ncbi:hypothetical protein TWF730_005062 [Orbilia blumenaviensis]|uniref:Uncharacterized protein n=1 Tax=Orbilia blumenaviensis TaxID=1796055 RepID=A0AAV9VH60_9PEZI